MFFFPPEKPQMSAALGGGGISSEHDGDVRIDQGGSIGGVISIFK